MKLHMSDPTAPAPPRQRLAHTTPRRAAWPARRLWLAIRRLDAGSRDPARPYRDQFHERDGGKLLFLRHRAKRGEFSGPEDRRDPAVLTVPPVPFPLPPAIPLPDAVVGYCRACGAGMTTDGDWCERCGGQPL